MSEETKGYEPYENSSEMEARGEPFSSKEATKPGWELWERLRGIERSTHDIRDEDGNKIAEARVTRQNLVERGFPVVRERVEVCNRAGDLRFVKETTFDKATGRFTRFERRTADGRLLREVLPPLSADAKHGVKVSDFDHRAPGAEAIREYELSAAGHVKSSVFRELGKIEIQMPDKTTKEIYPAVKIEETIHNLENHEVASHSVANRSFDALGNLVREVRVVTEGNLLSGKRTETTETYERTGAGTTITRRDLGYDTIEPEESRNSDTWVKRNTDTKTYKRPDGRMTRRETTDTSYSYRALSEEESARRGFRKYGMPRSELPEGVRYDASETAYMQQCVDKEDSLVETRTYAPDDSDSKALPIQEQDTKNGTVVRQVDREFRKDGRLQAERIQDEYVLGEEVVANRAYEYDWRGREATVTVSVGDKKMKYRKIGPDETVSLNTILFNQDVYNPDVRKYVLEK